MNVIKISDEEALKKAFEIRRQVFVVEQGVDPKEEYDEHERIATHFLTFESQGIACGTARWKETEIGIKLERFAVLKKYRAMGIGSALMVAVLDDVMKSASGLNRLIYLHAQISAIPFYEKFEFYPEGPQFDECGILHVRMKKKQASR